MLIDYQLNQTSIITRVKVRQDTTGASPGKGFTGLANTSSGLIVSTIADNEATVTAYTSTGSTIQTIPTLGTYSAPSAGNCRLQLVDNTHNPGIIELQFLNTRFAVSGAKSLLISITGVAGMMDCDVTIPLRSVNPYDGVRNGLSALPNAAAAAANGLIINGTNTGPMSISGGVTFSNNEGDAFFCLSTGGNGNGINATGAGAGNGIFGQGGSGFNGDGLHLVSGSASDSYSLRLDCSDLQDTQTSVYIVGTTMIYGNVAFQDGIAISSQTADTPGVSITGNGTAHDFVLDGDGVFVADLFGRVLGNPDISENNFAGIGVLASATVSAPVTVGGYSLNQDPATWVFSQIIDGGFSFLQTQRLEAAVLLGNSSGVDVGEPVYIQVNGSKIRVSGKAVNGNRTNLLYNPN